MGLDIRWPIGIMFSFIGILLVTFGAMTSSNTEMYTSTSLGVNINLIWGAVLLVFGVLMLIGAFLGRKRPPTA
jgi:hypothetical protein